MFAIPLKEKFKATARACGASVLSMSENFASIGDISSNFGLPRPQTLSRAGFLAASVLFFLQFVILTPTASALQSNAQPVPQTEIATFSPAFSESLRPALQQVGNSVGQINIDRWKLSQSWKAQLQSDANSIQQDLSHQLPGLFEQAQASPTALDAQLRVMQNVDALYNVLVRLTMAADLTEKKTDAALLDSAIERLEAARKTATGQIVQAAALQNQQLVQLQTRMREIAAEENASSAHAKTIVVDNDVRHGTRHRTVHHRKTAPSPTGAKSTPTPPQSSGAKPSPQN
jgi:hypothetical protein